MCWKVELWVEQWERIGEKGGKGGWAEQCPTEGGTDEVREKWREKRQEELRKGTHKEQKQGGFLSQEQPQNGNYIHT